MKCDDSHALSALVMPEDILNLIKVPKIQKENGFLPLQCYAITTGEVLFVVTRVLEYVSIDRVMFGVSLHFYLDKTKSYKYISRQDLLVVK